MEQSKIDMFIANNGDKFSAYQLSNIKDKLTNLPEDKFSLIMSSSYKDTTTMLILSIFLGSYGIDRFLLGDTVMGVLKLLTCGGCGIWTIIDWFSIKQKTYDYNFKQFNDRLMLC